jgi:hypothetical protein
MGLTGQTFQAMREEEFNKMPADMKALEFYEESIRRNYGDELADEYHKVIEIAKAKELLNNDKPTLEDLNNLFGLDELGDDTEELFDDDVFDTESFSSKSSTIELKIAEIEEDLKSCVESDEKHNLELRLYQLKSQL